MNKVLNNIRTYDLAESVYASGYPMMSKIPQGKDWEIAIEDINRAIKNKDYTNKHLKRAIKLANAKGGGHNQFLSGILVSFDVTFTNKGWVELERYRFLTFVSSQSTMHRISKMNVKECCSQRVDARLIEILNEKIDKYNETQSLEDYRDILDNMPSGLQLTARMTTSYRCLRNVVEQRKNHRLEIWQQLCEELKVLPMSQELIFGEVDK